MNVNNAIVFMDFDNIWIICESHYKINIFDFNFIDRLNDFLSEKNYHINEFTAYANFDGGKMHSDRHQTKLQKLGIQTRHCMNGKDSADIHIVCDALEKAFNTAKDIDTFVIISCDKDMTALINKLKFLGKTVLLITMSVKVDKDVMKRHSDNHFWFEQIVKIPFVDPDKTNDLTNDIFMDELNKLIKKLGTDVNYSLFSKTLQKHFKVNRSSVDFVKECLLKEKRIEVYDYEFRGNKYKDGIKILKF